MPYVVFKNLTELCTNSVVYALRAQCFATANVHWCVCGSTRDYFTFKFIFILHFASSNSNSMQVWRNFVHLSSLPQTLCAVEFSAVFGKLMSICRMSNVNGVTVFVFFLPRIHLYAFCMHPDCFAGDFAVWGLELPGLPQPGCGESPWSSNTEIKVCLPSGEATIQWPDCK